MLGVTGIKTTIVARLQALVPDEDVVWCGGGLDSFDRDQVLGGVRLDCDRYLLAQGYMEPARISEQDADTIRTSLAVNLVSLVQICEAVLDANPRARICVVGSQSAYRGSYDTTYAVAKAGLHAYVEFRALGPKQQLVGIAPAIIEDAGMTTRRSDPERVAAKAKQHPKQRHLMTQEVADMVHHLLYVDRGYTSNTVIRMDGRPL